MTRTDGNQLDDYLRIPYVLESSSVEREDGTWVRRADYVELPGCSAEAASIIEAIDAADVQRIRLLLGMWRAGERPPTPRPVLAERDIAADVHRLGLSAEYHETLRVTGESG